MGCVRTIDYDKFPEQGSFLGKRMHVLYNFSEPKEGPRPQGVVVRDDIEEPFLTIFKMDDGRYLLATECQWSPLPEK